MRINTILYIFTSILLVFGQTTIASAQTEGNSFHYLPVSESWLIGSKWRYTYALHVESNTIIHQADKDYQYFLYFKYDYSYEQFLNDKLTKGSWSLRGSTLNYSFKQIKQFEIAAINDKVLILEFTQPNSTGTYQYHFVNVESKDAPFIRAPDELPEVLVLGKYSKNLQKRFTLWERLFDRKKTQKETNLADAKSKQVPVNIHIELIGGGYYGGIDPVLRDIIQIKTDGRLIKEFQTVNNGLSVVKKNIPREELEQFAEFCVNNKFFEMERFYDCDSPGCQKRKRMKPAPVPLRLMITYGDKKKMITISIWGEDNRHIKYVDYPPALDNIIDAIQRMANRIETASK